jgi:hypothetical protein
MGMGGGGGGTKLTKRAKTGGQTWENVFDPSYFDGNSKYLSPGYKEAVDSGVEFGGYYQGAPGVGTFTSDGRYIEPGTDERLPTIMPGYEELARYDGLLSQYDAGALSPSQNALIGNAVALGSGDVGNSGGYWNALMEGGGLGMGGGGGGGVPAPPDFANRTLNVDNIGALAGDIFTDMPEPMQDFALDMLNTSDPAYVEGQVQDFAESVMEYVEMQTADNSRLLSDIYASAGIQNSGAFVAGITDMAVRQTIEASARVSEYALRRYEQVISQQGIAQSVMDSLLNAGASEQAQRVQFELGKMQAEATAYGSYASAQASIQNTLTNANAQIQAQLINSTAMLESNRMDFLGGQMSNLYGENLAANQQRTGALMLPYEQFNQQVGTTVQKGVKSDPLAGLGSAVIGGLSAAGGLGWAPLAPAAAAAAS